jgi:hypothetical protein
VKSKSNCRFVSVVGASGSGKSSLVWAGLTPGLGANAICSEYASSEDWLWLHLPHAGRDNRHPFEALAIPFMAVTVKLTP